MQPFVSLKKRLLLGLGVFAFAIGVPALDASAQYGTVAPPPNGLEKGFEAITPEKASEYLSVLAGPKLSGRGTGQDGFIKAAHYVAGKVAEFGLEPIGDGGTYFQMMPLTRRKPEMKKCKIALPNGKSIDGEGNLGLERMTNQATVEGEVVFLNLVGKRPQVADDVELRGKIVIYTTDTDAFNRAPTAIARKRPAASLRVVDGFVKPAFQTVFGGRRSRSTSVSGTINRTAASTIAESLGVDSDVVQVATEMRATSGTGNITINARLREEKGQAPNVVAFLRGSDPELRDEYVVIGSHLDHLGHRNGVVYPGADDNGSGSTAVLSIARAMAMNPVKPRRSVLFIWFAAEEVGLIGSDFYCENPILPLDKMTCMFNIDMVGRNEETRDETSEENEGHIHLIGSQKGNTKLHNLILAANEHVGFEFEYDQESVFPRSDQINFYRKGVPVAFLFGGFHPDYHQPSDTIEKINYKKVASAARLYYLAVHAAAAYGRFPLEKE